MIVIIGFLAATICTYAAFLTVAYRVVLQDQYAEYRGLARSADRPFSWWRFFWVIQTNLFRGLPFKPMTFGQAALIALMSLTPMAKIAHYFL